MMALVVLVIGLICGFGIGCWICVGKIEEVERRLYDAQAEIANLRAVAAWRQNP